MRVDHFRPKAGVKGDPDHDGYYWRDGDVGAFVYGASVETHRCDGGRAGRLHAAFMGGGYWLHRV